MNNNIRIHRPLADGIVNVLLEVFGKGRKASKAIEQILKENKRWGSRDRSFVAENSYEIIRWWRKLNFINNSEGEKINKAHLWKVFGTWIYMQYDQTLNWPEIGKIDPQVIEHKLKIADTKRKIKESIPDWLDEMGLQSLGDEWDNTIAFLNNQAPVYLRVNTLKTNAAELTKKLLENGIEVIPVPKHENILKVTVRKNLFSTAAFKEGLFEIQDLGSQMISEYLNLAPGMRVIDACAGAGGKSLHIATLLNNKGTVIAMDVEEWKLKELRKRARRNDIHNIEVRVIENSKAINRLSESADRVLLDVPCTGLGVLKRNPDAKWRIKPEFLKEVNKLQEEILQNYSKMVKKGGQIVYATCSILKSENENQVEKFLAANSNFKLLAQKNIRPSEQDSDGFYMASIERIS